MIFKLNTEIAKKRELGSTYSEELSRKRETITRLYEELEDKEKHFEKVQENILLTEGDAELIKKPSNNL